MGYVRVAPTYTGRLVRFSLTIVPEHNRRLVARRLREEIWNDELRPRPETDAEYGYSPSMATRLSALLRSVELEAAACDPVATHFVPEAAVERVEAMGWKKVR